MRCPLPGPRSRELAPLLAREAPGIAGFSGEQPPVVWHSARGSRVRDVDDNVYVDMSAAFAVVNVGHCHPRVVAAVRAQAEELLHGMGDVFPHERRARLAQRLATLAPIPDAQVYFATSGAEAVEIALKTAQLATGRSWVAAFQGGYHGLTYGALRVTSRKEFREPFEDALKGPPLWLPFPDPFRPPLDVRPLPREDGGRALAAACLETTRELLLDARSRGVFPGALVVEPVLGREGVVVPPAGWLAGLAQLCRELELLLVVDEVFTGFGRSGRRFAVQRENVVPDVLVVGKGAAGGLPIGAAIASRELFRVWDRGGEALHTSTFLAHPLACAAALAAVAVLEEEDLAGRAADWEEALATNLAALAKGSPIVGTVRGMGMMWGLELGPPDRPAHASANLAQTVVRSCLAGGVLLLRGGPGGNVLQLTPPLVLEEAEWRFASGVLGDALSAAVPGPAGGRRRAGRR